MPTKRNRKAKRHAGSWIAREKRQAIYFRDQRKCWYCGMSESQIEKDNIKRNDFWNSLSLDHIVPDSQGGSNLANNLITCCKRCNSKRGTKTIAEFQVYVGMSTRRKNQLNAKIVEIIQTNDSRSRAKNSLHLGGHFEKSYQLFKLLNDKS
tara:strand:+ start:270 stop:722 length:453 start_codon:yes stop_codon:yes gene_type:complete